VLITLAVSFRTDLATSELEKVIDEIETAIRQIVPAAKHIAVEAETEEFTRT
jgi:divalent metal cation (Fe/Co/Zn/Cd) transporter